MNNNKNKSIFLNKEFVVNFLVKIAKSGLQLQLYFVQMGTWQPVFKRCYILFIKYYVVFTAASFLSD